MKKKIYLFSMLPFFLFCGPSAKFISPDYSRPQKVAILPTINHTVDVEGATVFRNIFFVKLYRKKYAELLKNTQIDSILNEAGITDGGQLGSITQQDLVMLLKADGLFYIDLLECTTTPFEPGKYGTVKANIKLFSPADQLIWEDEQEVEKTMDSDSKSGFLADLMGDYLAEVTKKLVMEAASGWLFDHELKNEMDKLIDKTLKTLP
jgi:hypothetical protein